MAIATTCPNCKARFRLGDDLDAKKVLDKKVDVWKDVGEKDADRKKIGFKDKKVELPPIPIDFKLVLGSDGRIRVDGAITNDDQRQPFGKVGKSYALQLDSGQSY